MPSWVAAMSREVGVGAVTSPYTAADRSMVLGRARGLSS